MTILEISALSKSYGEGADRTEVLSDINLKVADGEFIAIVGFSGSGKTTLISLLAGLIKPDLGGVIFRGREVDSPGPERGVVFQSYSLMPWMTVAGNVSLAVDSVFKTKSRAERAAIVDKYIDMVGLGHARDRKPAELSGGMRQRVAVARALAMQPEVLLLDEPLSALDALTRAKLQDELADICQKEKKTIILITNDVDEAILLADRIIPLKPGPNATLGPDFPVDIARPRNRSGMNSDEDFIRLRREITSYLMEVGAERSAEAERKIVLPNIVPISLGRERLPKAYVAASTAVRADSFLEFSQLKKLYPTPKGPLTVVDGFEMKMRKGEFATLIGHSGCGKSTVLSMVAGLNPITEGAIISMAATIHPRPEHGTAPVVYQATVADSQWLTAITRPRRARRPTGSYPNARQGRGATSRREYYHASREAYARLIHPPAWIFVQWHESSGSGTSPRALWRCPPKLLLLRRTPLYGSSNST